MEVWPTAIAENGIQKMQSLSGPESMRSTLSLSDARGQSERPPQDAVVPQSGRNYVQPRAGPSGHLAPQLGAQGSEQRLPGLGDSASDHNPGRVQEHHHGLEASSEIHHVSLN